MKHARTLRSALRRPLILGMACFFAAIPVTLTACKRDEDTTKTTTTKTTETPEGTKKTTESTQKTTTVEKK